MWLHRRAATNDEGIAMIAVIMIGTVLFLLAGIMALRSQSDQTQVLGDRQWERALDVAEAGVDYTLRELSKDPSHNPNGWEDDCKDQAQVRACIIDTALAASETFSEDTVPVPDGEWVALKPQGEQYLYAVGFVPDRANPTKTRVLRVEYDFKTGFISPTAVLVDGDFELAGGAIVSGEPAEFGSIHANGNVHGDSKSAEFTGFLTASADCNTAHEECEPNQPKRVVPAVVPRDHYPRSQYDLCPDGWVRGGPEHPDPVKQNASGVPCAGPDIALAAGALTAGSRGWFKDGDGQSGLSPGKNKGAIWRRETKTPDHGVYYIFEGSAVIAGQAGEATNPWLVTVITEATESPDHCPHTGGDIDISGNVFLRYHDRTAPFIFVAGRDLKVTGKATTDERFTGAIVSHEQFLIEGNPVINGTVIAEDACDTTDSMVTGRSMISGNARINYNGDLELPFGETIRTTHWLEL